MNEWERQEERRELYKRWRSLSLKQKAGLNALASSILRAEAIKRGYFDFDLAGVNSRIFLN